MKALILSFFAVILGYSFFFNEKNASEQSLTKETNSMYVKPSVEAMPSDTLLVSNQEYKSFNMM